MQMNGSNKQKTEHGNGFRVGAVGKFFFVENYCWMLVKEIRNYHGHNNYENAKGKNYRKFFYIRGRLQRKKWHQMFSKIQKGLLLFFSINVYSYLMFLTALNHIKITTLTTFIVFSLVSRLFSLHFTFFIFQHNQRWKKSNFSLKKARESFWAKALVVFYGRKGCVCVTKKFGVKK